MKAGLKKLRSCSFSRARVSKAFFSSQKQYNQRLVCDHPEMRTHWTERSCVDCSSYRNRNEDIGMESGTADRQKTPPPAGDSQ